PSTPRSPSSYRTRRTNAKIEGSRSLAGDFALRYRVGDGAMTEYPIHRRRPSRKEMETALSPLDFTLEKEEVVACVTAPSQQADETGETDQLVEDITRTVGIAGLRQCLGEPERTREERAFGTGEAVVAGRVAVQQRSTRAESLADGPDSAQRARRVGRFEVEK